MRCVEILANCLVTILVELNVANCALTQISDILDRSEHIDFTLVFQPIEEVCDRTECASLTGTISEKGK